jgi:hypothetical protein
MDTIPRHFLADLSPTEVDLVAAWWTGLAEADRTELATLCDDRQEQCFWGLASDDPATPVPVVIGGRFLPRDDTAGWEEWYAEVFDFLVCYPDPLLYTLPVIRTFHICTRHAAARAVLASGRVPAEFHCPLATEDCPMERLATLAPGRYLRLIQLGTRVESPEGKP